MKRYILTFATLALLVSCNNTNKENSQQDSSAATTEITSENASAAAVIKFDEETYNFGKIKDGEKVSYSFTFTNKGDTPLIIKDASATCGCTVPEWPKEPIAPGKTGKIAVVFDSAGKSGLQDKVITITANTVPSQTQLHLIGEITNK